jgi:hypothetical protein
MEVQLDQQCLLPFTWPHTHCPEFGIRSFWRSALMKTLLCSTDSHRLAHPLVSFLPSVSNTWHWKYSPSEQWLFEPTGPCWDFYHVVSGRRQSVHRLHHLGGSTHHLPPDSQAATFVQQGSNARLISFGSPSTLLPIVPRLSFSQILDSPESSLSWAIQEFALPSDLQPIIASLKSGSARAISDGSFKINSVPQLSPSWTMAPARFLD